MSAHLKIVAIPMNLVKFSHPIIFRHNLSIKKATYLLDRLTNDTYHEWLLFAVEKIAHPAEDIFAVARRAAVAEAAAVRGRTGLLEAVRFQEETVQLMSRAIGG